MNLNREIAEVYFVEDSDDEVFITGITFERQSIALKLVHFFNLPSYFAHMETRSVTDLRHSISVFDLNLTVAKGTDGISQLRDRPHYQGHIAGICSGSDDPADRESAVNAGADFFVPKPLNLTALGLISASVPSLELAERDGKHTLVSVMADQIN